MAYYNIYALEQLQSYREQQVARQMLQRQRLTEALAARQSSTAQSILARLLLMVWL